MYLIRYIGFINFIYDIYKSIKDVIKLNKLIKEYNEKYSNLPDVKETLIQYIKDNYKINWNNYNQHKEEISKLYQNEINLALMLEPHPSPRPRSTSSGRFYVKGAGLHKAAMKELVKDCKIICTATEIDIKTYHRPPESIPNDILLLAEEGLIRPLSNGDWDNLAKTYCDMIQGVLIMNDNIITTGSLSKYYSIKPRIEITLRYQNWFDCKYNMRKILKSKIFKELTGEVLLSLDSKERKKENE